MMLRWEETEPKDDRPKVLCDKCGREMLESEAISVYDGIYGYDFLCEDCLSEYAEEISYDYADEYIDIFLGKQFYDQWFETLDVDTKTEILKDAFSKPKYWSEISKEEMEKRQEKFKKEFCNGQNEFLNYVVSRIKG